MKTKNIIIMFVILVLAVLSIFYSGLFSATSTFEGASTTSPQFRQEVSCGRATTFQFDAIRIDYTTQLVDAKLIDPDEREDKTECIPKDVKVYEDNNLIYHWNDGVVQEYTGDKNHQFVANIDRTLDSGLVYIFPNGWTNNLDLFFYGKLYDSDLDNNGHNRDGYSLGSELYFDIYYGRGNLTSEIISSPEYIIDNNKLEFKVTSHLPDVCF